MEKTNQLRLPLTKKWFEMTKSGIKTEDYRDFNAKNCCKYLLSDGQKMNTKFWETFFTMYKPEYIAEFLIGKNSRVSLSKFTNNIMTLGYPKSTDTERILKFEHKRIEIRTGNPEWGAEPNKLYFVIKHGEIF